MRIIYKGKNALLTPPLKMYLEEKLVRSVKKLVGSNGENLPLLEIEFGRTTKHHRKGPVWRAEANLTLGKYVMFAEAFGEDPREAIDLLEEELKREVKGFKEKNRTKDRTQERALKRRIKKSL